jgi:hypothetical protein
LKVSAPDPVRTRPYMVQMPRQLISVQKPLIVRISLAYILIPRWLPTFRPTYSLSSEDDDELGSLRDNTGRAEQA